MSNSNRMDNLISKNESISRMMITLAIPTIIEQILETVVQYVDTAMVGRLGEEATAAVSVTTTITWLMYSIPSAIGVGVLALISRSMGERNISKANRVAMLAILSCLVLGIVESAVACGLAKDIPIWMGAETNIQEVAGKYFLIICIPMIFRVMDSVLAAAIRATGDTKVPMYINFGVNIMNIVLNYILIYTVGLGVIGAAIATAISVTFGGSAMYIAFRKHFNLRNNEKSIWSAIKASQQELSVCLKISIPAALTSIVSCAGYVMFARLVAGLGTTTFAAHSIAVTAETIFYIPGYGMKTAVSTMVGFSVGERDEHKFKTVVRYASIAAFVMMTVSGAILFFVAEPFMHVFTPSEDVVKIGASVLRIVSVSEPFFGLMIILQGVYNGLGKTTYSFAVELIGMWLVRILVAYIGITYFSFGIREVWFCMIADNILKAILYGVGVPKSILEEE